MNLFCLFSIFLALSRPSLASNLTTNTNSSFSANQTAPNYTPIIHLPSGPVRGLSERLNNGTSTIHLYFGLRYGTARRFSRPKPAQPWTELYNATLRAGCPQRHLANRSVWYQTNEMSEDCLFASVWVPGNNNATKSPKAVMVWIHGGGFESGTIFSLLYDGRHLAVHGDVIVVSLAYRLDAFGFLFGGTEDSPGNLGLHDLLLGLRWVQVNIPYFGGDPNRVTLFGHSAGAMSVGALVLSPLAAGLFQRVILQSGAPNSYFGSESQAASLRKTQRLLYRLNCLKSDNFTLNLDCLRRQPIETILNATGSEFYSRHYGFIPVYGDALLPIRPVEALKSGHQINPNLDVLYGLTSDEGSTFVGSMFPEFLNKSKLKRDRFTLDDASWRIVQMMKHYGEPFGYEVARYYTSTLSGPGPRTWDSLRGLVAQAFADYFFVCPLVLFAESYASHSPNSSFYSYKLTSAPDFPFGDCSDPKWMKVCHGSDILYLFILPNERFFGHLNVTEKDRGLSRRMIAAWSSFAKSGQPQEVKWEPALKAPNYLTNAYTLSSGNNSGSMSREGYRKSCNEFWKGKIFL